MSVVIPGVPEPITLPTDCEGAITLSCTIDKLTVGASRSFSFDFGRLLTEEVTAPFEPQVESLSTDPGIPEHNVAGDPEELLMTDVQVTAALNRTRGSKKEFRVTVTNISGITAYDVILLMEDMSLSIWGGATLAPCLPNLGGGNCGPLDVAPGESRIVEFEVSSYGPNAGARVTLANEDRNPSNNRVSIAAAIDELQDGDGVGDSNAQKTEGCSATGTPKDTLLLAAVAAIFTTRRRRQQSSVASRT